MGVSAEVAAGLAEQLKDWKPGAAAPAETGVPQEEARAQAGWSVLGSTSEFGKEIGSAAALGYARGGDFLKGIAAGSVMPFIPEGETPGAETARRLLLPAEDTELIRAMKQRATRPQTLGGKLVNPAAEGVGGIAAMPMGGGVMRNLIAGIGMGEGAEIGKKALGGLFAYFGGEPSRGVGEATGSVVGGGIGAQLNVARVRAMGEAFNQVGDAVKSIVPAYQAARAAQAAGDKRALHAIFADEFGSLRAQTRGVIENFVNRSLADTIRRDIRASTMAEEFVRDAKVTDMDIKPWGLGERVMVPALTALVRERRPASLEEAGALSGRAGAMQRAIGAAYERLAGPQKMPATPEGIKAAAQTFQAITQHKVDALATQEWLAKARFSPLSASDEFALGTRARALRDDLAKEAGERAAAQYKSAEDLFDAEGARVAVGNIREQGKALLREFYPQVDPTQVPPVVRNMLSATGPKPAPDLILPEGARAAAAEAKDLSLKDANDLVRAFGKAASNARATENHGAFNNAQRLQAEVLAAIDKAPASEAAKQAYGAARANYRTDYAERFQEGFGKALGKERGGVMEGHEALRSEDVLAKFLAAKETGMRDFDRIYGGNPEAGRLLVSTVNSKFRKEVLDAARTPQMLEDKLREFKANYSPALQRMPQILDRMEAESASIYKLRLEQDAELARYKDIMGAPVTRKIGAVQAKQMFESALSDPDKMRGLLASTPKGEMSQALAKEVFQQAHPFRNGEYDPEALFQLIRAGKSKVQGPSSMEVLFQSAFGEAPGKRHMDTLEAIGNFVKREAVTNPQHLRPESLLADSPIRGQTGQSFASWISAWRAQEMGATGSTYFATLGLSRFVNAKAQQAVENAKMKALYDPTTADAILEMAAKPTTDPLSITSARKIFGDIRMTNGKKLVDHLLDRGYVKAYVARGLIHGAAEAEAEQKAPHRSTAKE